MGVKHLWAILQGAGTSFDYESLRGQVISVDINIWLHQIQSHRVGQNPHAYLIDLLKRICKLLNYGIKPIFVFDGAHPKLKQDTIISRDLRRRNAQKQHDEAKFKHILKTIHSQLLQGQVPCLPSTSSGPADLFELPPSSSTVFETDHSDDEYDDLTSIQQIIHLNPKSEEFSNLPSDIQTGILKLQSTISISSNPSDHPSNPDSMRPEDVSNEQIRKLKERRELRQTIENINKGKKEETNSAIIGLESQQFRVQSDKVVSQDTKHVILVRNAPQNDTKFSITSNLHETGPMDLSSEPYTPVTQAGRYYGDTNIPLEENGHVPHEVATDLTDDDKQKKTLVKISFTDGTQIFAEQEVDGKLTSITSFASQSDVGGINPSCVSSSVQVPLENLSPHLDGIHLSNNHQKGFKRTKSPKCKTNLADLGLVIPPKSAVKYADCPSHASDEVFTTPSLTPRAKRVCQQDTPALENESNLDLYTETVPNSFSEESIPPTPISPSYDTSEPPNPCSVPLPPTPSEDSCPSSGTLYSSQPSQDLTATTPILAPSASLQEVQRELSELRGEMSRSERMIHGVNREIQDAVMELLNVFGIPFIVAPFEAEAQCANLELNMVTSGTITDDSDIFLFGGHTVYRHFFSMKSRLGPQCYSMNAITSSLDLRRDDLVRLAFLLGCDYTEGVKGVGPKNAVLLLKSFKSEGLQLLTNILAASEVAKSGLKEKCGGEDGLLSRVEFPRGFPDENVWVAFMTPLVDPVPLEEFKWGSIDVDRFVNFSKRYFNWKENQAREQITPVLRRQSTPKQTPSTIPRCTPSLSPQEPIKADYKPCHCSSGSDSN